MSQVPRVEPGQHVALVLHRIGGAGEQQPVFPLHDASVVPRRKPRSADPAPKREELRKSETSVAADTRIGRLTAGVAAHERRHHRPPKLLAQIERHMGQSECMTCLPRCDHGARGAAGSIRVRTGGVEPQPQRDANSLRAGAEQGHGAVDAAAHGDGDPVAVRTRRDGRSKGVCERVHRKSLASDRGSLEQREALQVRVEAIDVGVDDPPAVDAKPGNRPLLAAGGISQ